MAVDLNRTEQRPMSAAWRMGRPRLVLATSGKDAAVFAGSCDLDPIQVHTRSVEGFSSTREVQRP